MNLKIITGALVVSSIAVAALAHGGASGIVKERMDAMTSMSDGIKVLLPMMQGRAEYDAQKIKQAADAIESHAGETLTKLFPDGSGSGHSDAKPEVWENWWEFESLAMQLQHFSKGLNLAADNGLAQAAMATMDSPSLEELAGMPANQVFKLLGKTCGTCHRKFRVKK